MGFGDLDRVLTIDDLCKGENVIFVATGITDGDLVRGVRFMGNQARTHSILIHAPPEPFASSRVSIGSGPGRTAGT